MPDISVEHRVVPAMARSQKEFRCRLPWVGHYEQH